ncbi:MAG: hypothetical protein QHI38_08185 [Armatimonadota bacterium]|nr:hypothetical protein [Armatimonadota bacterium]
MTGILNQVQDDVGGVQDDVPSVQDDIPFLVMPDLLRHPGGLLFDDEDPESSSG